MIANAEQQQWRSPPVLDLRVAQEEVAHAKAEAANSRLLLRDELGAQILIVEQRASAVEHQALTATAELRSAKAEADELSRSRLQHGLEAQLTVETLRGSFVAYENRAEAIGSTLRSELQEARMTFQSNTALGELVKQTQEKWSVADAALRASVEERKGLAAEVAALRTELNSLRTTGQVDTSRLDSELAKCKASLVSVQSELDAERTKVSRLIAEAKNEKAIREAGRMRSEGKGYVMADGDVAHFLFNV
jgi:hypothetical protein